MFCKLGTDQPSNKDTTGEQNPQTRRLKWQCPFCAGAAGLTDDLQNTDIS